MKNKAMLYMMMAMAGMLYANPSFSEDESKSYGLMTENDKRMYMEKLKEAKRRALLKKGVKEFKFEDVTIIAINQKNADRKYQRFLTLRSELN